MLCDCPFFNADPATVECKRPIAFQPVTDLQDLLSLDANEVIAGYISTQRGDPEPGPNRGRAFWHGWRNRMIDYGELPPDAESHELAHAVVKAESTKCPVT